MAVYFIRNLRTRSIKIGFSEMPEARIAELQTGCEDQLVLEAILPAGAETERHLHSRWGDSRIRGEWFCSTPDLDSFVSAVAILRAVEQTGGQGALQNLVWFILNEQSWTDGWSTVWLRSQLAGREIFPLPEKRYLEQALRYFLLDRNI